MRTRAFVPVTLTVLLVMSAATAGAQSQTPLSPQLLTPGNPNVFGQIDFGGRLTGATGDQARYQRYRDLRDGAFLSIPYYYRETDRWWTRVSIQNVGYRDQRYELTAARPGKVRFRFLYDQTPTFISADTRTPYTPRPQENGFYDGATAALTLPDSVQAAIEADPSLIRSQVEGLATGFPTRIRRDSLGFEVEVDFTPNWESKVKYLNTKKEGAIPWGASFGFNMPVEIALPIDTRTNDFGASLEWHNNKGMLRAGYDGSWFDQQVPVYTWDNALRLTDRTYSSAYSPGDGTSQGRGTEWPSNSFYYVNFAGAYRPAPRTSVNATVSLGQANQDQALVPYTINTAIAPLNDVSSLDRLTAEAKADVSAATVNFVTRPASAFSVNARYRLARYDNKTPHFERTEYVRFDQVAEPGGPPEFQGYTRNYVDVDAAYTGVRYTTFRVGYGYQKADYEERVYFGSNDNTFRVGVDTVGSQYVSFRSVYEHSRRRGDGLHAETLEEAGELLGMRHYDVAARDRDRVMLVTNLMGSGSFGVNALVAWTRDDYQTPERTQSDSFGLLNYKTQTYGAGLDYLPGDRFGAGLSYNFDKYDGLSQSRNWSPTGTLGEDPNRNWTTDEAQKGHSVVAYVEFPKLLTNTEARIDYDYSRYRGLYTYATGSAYRPSALEPDGVSQLPAVMADEHRLSADFRYFIRRNVAVGGSYWYDKYEVTDFALSPPGATFVQGVARPAIFEDQAPDSPINGIVLNYLYRPYTAHTAWLRLTYLW